MSMSKADWLCHNFKEFECDADGNYDKDVLNTRLVDLCDDLEKENKTLTDENAKLKDTIAKLLLLGPFRGLK